MRELFDRQRRYAAGVNTSAPTTAYRAQRPLHLLLATANFAVGMGAFVVVGVLSQIAVEYQVTQADAGWLITIFAIVYAIASPVLVSTTGRVDRVRVLCAGLLFLGGGALAGALAPDYAVLLASRAVMAIGAGIITPVAAAIGVATTEPDHRGRALATIFGGLTLAQALGVPAGAWIGNAFGWRFAFGIVATLSLAAAILINYRALRGLRVEPVSLATLAKVLTLPRLVVAVSFTAFFMAGVFVLYTYLTPFLQEREALGRTGISAMLLVFGIGAILGNALGGFLTDRIGSMRTLSLLCLVQLAIMPLITLAIMPVVVMGIAVGVWSVFAWSFHVPQQARLAALDPHRAPVLLALHSAGVYVGASIGSAIGGQAIRHVGLSALGPAGASIIVVALLALAFAGTRAGGYQAQQEPSISPR